MNIHTVTLPDGTTATRKSENRIYTHVVISERQNGSYDRSTWPMKFIPDGTTTWVAESWAGSERLARNAMQQLRGVTNVRVVPCQMAAKTVTPKDPAVKAKAEATRLAGYIGGHVQQQVAWIVSLEKAGHSERAEKATESLVAYVTKQAHHGTTRLAMEEGGAK